MKKECEVHRGVEMPKSTGWYGVKLECPECLMDNHSPNGKLWTKLCKKHKWKTEERDGGGIGIRTIKKCYVCGREKDITNYESW